MNTITEYTELICDIYAIKKFIGRNAEYEKQIMSKIENISDNNKISQVIYN